MLYVKVIARQRCCSKKYNAEQKYRLRREARVHDPPKGWVSLFRLHKNSGDSSSKHRQRSAPRQNDGPCSRIRRQANSSHLSGLAGEVIHDLLAGTFWLADVAAPACGWAVSTSGLDYYYFLFPPQHSGRDDNSNTSSVCTTTSLEDSKCSLSLGLRRRPLGDEEHLAYVATRTSAIARRPNTGFLHDTRARVDQ